MKSIIFKGKEFAKRKEKELGKKVFFLSKKGISLKLVSILVGENEVSKLFLSLKKKAAERVGIELEIKRFPEGAKFDELSTFIKEANEDSEVNGIMVQLPLPESFSSSKRDELLALISPQKDVDGMREKSIFLTPTAKSVLYILKEADSDEGLRVCVVGARGFVGRRVVFALKSRGYGVRGVDLDTKNLKEDVLGADILISATGKPGLIKKEMVEKGAIVIDVGAPKGDIDKGVEERAGFFSRVPGGVGPVTIVSLLENVVESI